MNVIFDKISNEPTHALTLTEVKVLHKILNSDLNFRAKTYRFCSELPEKSRFDRPVHYDSISRKLNVCSRGLSKEKVIREILVEAIQQSNGNLRAPSFNSLSVAQRKLAEELVNPLYAKYIENTSNS